MIRRIVEGVKMIDFKKFISKDFWSKKEISYQYVHFTNACAIAYFACMIFTTPYVAVLGFATGVAVEVKQWLGGNHKVEDMIRDLVFWALGSVCGALL